MSEIFERYTIELKSNSTSGASGAPFAWMLEGEIEIHKNRMVRLDGPNGCGKSTFLKALAGEHPLFRLENNIHFLKGLTREQVMPREVFYVGEPYEFGQWVRTADVINCSVFAFLGESPPNEMLKETQLIDVSWLSRPYSKLSYGQRKRVMLAAAVVSKPRLLFLDEPFAGLDHSGRDRLIEILSDKNSKFQFTGILVTHELFPDLAGIVRRRYSLHGGKLEVRE